MALSAAFAAKQFPVPDALEPQGNLQDFSLQRRRLHWVLEATMHILDAYQGLWFSTSHTKTADTLRDLTINLVNCGRVVSAMKTTPEQLVGYLRMITHPDQEVRAKTAFSMGPLCLDPQTYAKALRDRNRQFAERIAQDRVTIRQHVAVLAEIVTALAAPSSTA